MSYVSFLKINLAYIKLGISSRMAYPFDLIIGVLIIPLFYFLGEVAFWLGLIKASGRETLAGFPASYYIGYCLWTILQLGSVNWRFERVMIAEINNGTVNASLLRPSSFYQYHLGQLLGQKLMTALMMTPVILMIASIWHLPFYLERLPLALLMGFCYLLLLFSLHFAIASMAFFFNHVYSLNFTKNMFIWFLSGELMPLDLLPAPLRDYVLWLPFSSGVYRPAAYLSGRITREVFAQGFISLTIGAVFFGLIASFVWRKGLRCYGGTGA